MVQLPGLKIRWQSSSRKRLSWTYVARELFGESLKFAPMGAIRKDDGTVRTLHDGTHSSAANPNQRIRDQLKCPGSNDVRYVLAFLHGAPGRTWGLKADVSKAHRRYKHRPADWGLMSCQLSSDPEHVWINKVGTFGLGCASYWWTRLFSLVCRTASPLALDSVFFQLLFLRTT